MHKKSTKLFKNHVAFLIEKNSTPDHFISEDDAPQFSDHNSGDIHTDKCARHTHEHLVLFCTDHMDTLCGRCVVSFHKSCKLIDLFDVHVDDEEVSTSKSKLHDIEEELKSVEDKIEKNTHTNKACKNGFLTELQKLRTDLNTWFDDQLLKCEKQCNTTFQTNSERLTKVQTFCNELRQRIQERKELIDKLITQNHVKRLYVLLNQIRQEIEHIKLKFHWLNSESDFNCYNFKRSSGLDQLLKVNTFDIGSIEEWCSGSDEVSDDVYAVRASNQNSNASNSVFEDVLKQVRISSPQDAAGDKGTSLAQASDVLPRVTSPENSKFTKASTKIDVQAVFTQDESLAIKKLLHMDKEKTTAEKVVDTVNPPKSNGRRLSLMELFKEAKTQPPMEPQWSEKHAQPRNDEASAKAKGPLPQQKQHQQQQQQQGGFQGKKEKSRPADLNPPSHRNPVMELLTLCQSLQMKLPLYDYIPQNGKFVCVVSLVNGNRCQGSPCNSWEEAAESAASVVLLQMRSSMQ